MLIPNLHKALYVGRHHKMKTLLMERDLLEYLEKQPLPGYANLSTYFRTKYPNHEEISKDIKVLLDELFVERGYITILFTGVGYSELGREKNIHGDTGIVTFDTLDKHSYKQSSKITLKGREYLATLIRNEKQDQLNESFRIMNEKTIPDQNRRQNILTISTVIFSLLTTIFIGIDTCGKKTSNTTYTNQRDTTIVLLNNKTTLSDTATKAKSQQDSSGKNKQP
ncbi:MAG: hypothetical protein JWQ09_5545 [Segetibacter sp.]|nr:hypothetical protein [Segetibacter sp.]